MASRGLCFELGMAPSTGGLLPVSVRRRSWFPDAHGLVHSNSVAHRKAVKQSRISAGLSEPTPRKPQEVAADPLPKFKGDSSDGTKFDNVLSQPSPLEMGLRDNNLESTLEHRVWVGIGAAAVLGMLTKVVTAAHFPEDAIPICLAISSTYFLSDLGTGVYHWAVDNYGSAQMPIFGAEIDSFQGHHKRPWTITKRQFANNIHALARPAAIFLGPFLLQPPHPAADAFLGSLLSLVILSQQFHAWAHAKRSQLPSLVVWLQEKGLLLSRKTHCAHHKPPYGINYCIVSGWWNPILDENRVFARLEEFIHEKFGVAPQVVVSNSSRVVTSRWILRRWVGNWIQTMSSTDCFSRFITKIHNSISEVDPSVDDGGEDLSELSHSLSLELENDLTITQLSEW